MLTPILIAGPTASGKSALALSLAQQHNGVVINADSMQIYDCWERLSARPSATEMAGIPHRLYGHVSAQTLYSVGEWLRDLEAVLSQCQTQDQRPIIVGGTGLYFTALTKGLAQIPPIPTAITEQGESTLANLGREGFYHALCTLDPRASEIRDPQNPMRLLRAWNVFQATGQSLFDWMDATPPALLPIAKTKAFLLTPPRDWLYERCDQRFDQMIEQGALDEVRKAKHCIQSQSLAANTIGAKELFEYLQGNLTQLDAIAAAKMATRRYAKRQTTWFKNQMRHWQAVSLQHYYDKSAFSGIFLNNLD